MEDTKQRLLEVCVDNVTSALNAARGGAGRIELCSSLADGGLTPSAGFLKVVKSLVTTPIFAMLRCERGSDFCYSETDMRIMLSDLLILKEIGADGFVFGALKRDRSLDEEACVRIVEAASPLPVTFHRAFDVCTNPLITLESVISIGFKRILTSGQQKSAGDDVACNFIKKLVEAAADRIIIMPGAGVSFDNIAKILKTGVKEVHGSFRGPLKNTSDNLISMGTSGNEIILVTDEILVRDVIACLNNV